MPLIVIGMLEPFIRFTLLTALVVPMVWLPKLKLVADKARFTTPVPLSVTIWGLVDALSAIVIAPVRAPIAIGAKTTLMVHDFPEARLAPQVPVGAIAVPAGGNAGNIQRRSLIV